MKLGYCWKCFQLSLWTHPELLKGINLAHFSHKHQIVANNAELGKERVTCAHRDLLDLPIEKVSIKNNLWFRDADQNSLTNYVPIIITLPIMFEFSIMQKGQVVSGQKED